MTKAIENNDRMDGGRVCECVDKWVNGLMGTLKVCIYDEPYQMDIS